MAGQCDYILLGHQNHPGLEGADRTAGHGRDSLPDAQTLQLHDPLLLLPGKGLTVNTFSSMERVPLSLP